MLSNHDFQKENHGVAVKIINCFRDLSVWINKKKPTHPLVVGVLTNTSDCTFLTQTRDKAKSYDTLAYLFMCCEERVLFV